MADTVESGRHIYDSERYPLLAEETAVRIDQSHVTCTEDSPCSPLPRGIYPYFGGSVDAARLRAAVMKCGCAVVPGVRGARLVRQIEGALLDPAVYSAGAGADEASDVLFDCDEWLERQRAAEVPIMLTDTPRIRNRDRSALRKALGRWEKIAEPVLVVLPIECWWLGGGLACLTEEVKAAGRPVALVLLHSYNGLDAAGAVAGLMTFMSAVAELPVVLLRCDISAVGAVAYGGFAGFVGVSATTRHGPVPLRRKTLETDGQDERDASPSVFVPALHDYFKASRLPSFARREQDEILHCHDPLCGGQSLLRISRLAEVDLAAARARALDHNMASAELLARTVLTSGEPRDVWWERCKSGADLAVALSGRGVSLPVSRWLRQWLDLGSPAHDPVTVR